MSRAAAALSAALAEHRAALDAYAARAGRVPPEDWERPCTPGKWSPAEITEHLRLALEKLREELEGKPAMRIVLPAWKTFLLRRTILRRILRTRRFPRNAPAPREIRPASPGLPRDTALKRLVDEADRFETASRAGTARGRRLTHPYFGTIPLARFHRLLATHARHHGEQIPESR